MVEIDELAQFYWLQLDDGKGRFPVYLTGNVDFQIPFGEKRINLFSKVFCGSTHLISVKKARYFDVEGYRNLAINIWD